MKGRILHHRSKAWFFTITKKKSPEETPHYIISKDVALNEITISSSPVVDGVSSSKEILISGVNWISGKIPDVNKKYKEDSLSPTSSSLYN